MRKPFLPKAKDSLVQRSIERCLERIDRLRLRVEPCEPFLNYREALDAEHKTLKRLEQVRA